MLRKCMHKGKTAYFHGWYQLAYLIDSSPFVGGHPGGQVAFPVAILELEDGSLVRAAETEFTFQAHPLDEQLIMPYDSVRTNKPQEEGAPR